MSTNNPYDPARSRVDRTAGHGPAGYGPRTYGQADGYGTQWYPDQGPGGYGYGGYGGPQSRGTGFPPFGGRQPGRPVGPVEAVQRLYSQYFQFSGRASRSEFWWAQLFYVVAYLLLAVPAGVFQDPALRDIDVVSALLTLFTFAFALVSLVPLLAVAVRRLHDANFSGWFYLLVLVPFVGGIVLLVLWVLPPRPEGARFDR